MGIEPTTISLENWDSTAELRPHQTGLERVRGIEPPYSAWEAAALPLSYTRMPFHLNARPFDGKLRTDTNINAKGLRRDTEDPFSRGAVCGDKERPP